MRDGDVGDVAVIGGLGIFGGLGLTGLIGLIGVRERTAVRRGDADCRTGACADNHWRAFHAGRAGVHGLADEIATR